jgi:hypothetical protein
MEILDIVMIMCGLGALHFFFLAFKSLDDK